MNKTLLGAAAALIAIPTAALVAQTATPEKPAKPPMTSQTRADVEMRTKERLGRFDANKDGTVTRDEIMSFADARMKERNNDMFAMMDTDKNGSISRAEFDAHHADPRHGKGPHVMHIEASSMGEAPRSDAPRGDKADAHGRRMRMMMVDPGGLMMMAEGGDTIIIADAVKKALDRFDAADANKDGVLSPDERREAREARRAAWKAKASS
jgi:EF-hand domain pair/EF hand